MRWLLLLLVMVSGRATAAEPLSADALARRLLDGEALYTVTGGLKPVSDGFWQTRFPATQDTSPEVDEARRLLATLPLGPDLEAGVYVFTAAHEGKKSASAFVAHKPSLRALVNRRADVFGPLGITADTPPQRVMEKIDRGPRSARWRAYGLVFGYPEYAVEFFVEAGERQAETKTFVERDFVQLHTFASEEGRFIYAVPKGHAERDEDRQLKTTTADTFARYRAWRTVYLDDQKLGAVELLQNWITPPVVVSCRPPVVCWPTPGVAGPPSRCETPRLSRRHRR
jgi:hypothetical protein